MRARCNTCRYSFFRVRLRPLRCPRDGAARRIENSAIHGRRPCLPAGIPRCTRRDRAAAPRDPPQENTATTGRRSSPGHSRSSTELSPPFLPSFLSFSLSPSSSSFSFCLNRRKCEAYKKMSHGTHTRHTSPSHVPRSLPPRLLSVRPPAGGLLRVSDSPPRRVSHHRPTDASSHPRRHSLIGHERGMNGLPVDESAQGEEVTPKVSTGWLLLLPPRFSHHHCS